MKRQVPRSGYVLVMVLLVVFLAGVALAGLARLSLVAALQSQGALEDLQRRWAVTSCRATLLGRVEELLDEAERGRGEDGQLSKTHLNAPMIERRAKFRLAGVEYEVVLTDEQAKLNLNRLLDETSRAEVQSVVAQWVSEAGAASDRRPEVNLQTLMDRENVSEENEALPRLGGYDQVFDNVSPKQLIGDDAAVGLAGAITFWGDGKVNLRRAPARVLEQACGQAIGPDVVTALLAVRQSDPYRKLSAMLAESDGIAKDRKEKVYDYVTDGSACHGLWVIARGAQRSWYTLAVSMGGGGAADGSGQDGGEPHVGLVYEFAW